MYVSHFSVSEVLDETFRQILIIVMFIYSVKSIHTESFHSKVQ